MGTQWKLKETHVKYGKEYGNIMTVYSLELSLFSCKSDCSQGLLVGMYQFQFQPIPIPTNSNSNQFQFQPIPIPTNSNSNSRLGIGGIGRAWELELVRIGRTWSDSVLEWVGIGFGIGRNWSGLGIGIGRNWLNLGIGIGQTCCGIGRNWYEHWRSQNAALA